MEPSSQGGLPRPPFGGAAAIAGMASLGGPEHDVKLLNSLLLNALTGGNAIAMLQQGLGQRALSPSVRAALCTSRPHLVSNETSSFKPPAFASIAQHFGAIGASPTLTTAPQLSSAGSGGSDMWSEGASLVNSSPTESQHSTSPGTHDLLSQMPGIASTRTSVRRQWRKYGQKRLNDNMVRSYYRCSVPGCLVKRQVVSTADHATTSDVRTIGEHNHKEELTVTETHVPVNQLNGAQHRLEMSQAGLASLPSDPSARLPPEAGQEVDASVASRIFVSVPSLVITDPSSPSNAILCSSPAFRDFTGYSEDALIGKSLKLLEGSGTDPKSSQALTEALSGPGPAQVVILFYKKCGDPFWCMLNIEPLHRPDGTVLGCLAQLMDVTKRPKTSA